MEINGQNIDINNLLEEDYSKKMHKKINNDIYLSDEQVEILKRYNINYQKCTSIMELINIIDEIIYEEEIPELDAIAYELAEFKYYHLTNK